MDVNRGSSSQGDTGIVDEPVKAGGIVTPPRVSNAVDEEHARLVDEQDRRRKHVDSGKVAILFSTDSFAAFKEKWSGTSKERRQWAADVLRRDKSLGAKLIFIEVIVTKEEMVIANVRSKYHAEHPERDHDDELPPQLYREFNRQVQSYKRKYVTLQDDGSEDDLSYIKLINYGDKVVTNRMHGYLRMRIAQFLTVIHPARHTIYLSRHGQSEYNVLGKIGGNPPLSAAGAEYAQRLGAWVPEHVCKQRRNEVVRLEKARLWTSSLQRTILTASHIPHPLIPSSQFGRRLAPNGTLMPPTGPPTPLNTPLNITPVKMSPMGTPMYTSPTPQLRCPEGMRSLDSLDIGVSACDVIVEQTSLLESDSLTTLRRTKDGRHASRDDVRIHSCISRLMLDEEEDEDPPWEQMSPRVYRNLDEIFAGEYEGYTYEEIKSKNPDEASLRAMDKIGYRYPRGESYFDILARLDPLVHELESYHEPLMIVSHQAVLRLLYAYLTGQPREKAPRIEIPLHTVMKITYDGWNAPFEERFVLGPEPVQKSDGQQNL